LALPWDILAFLQYKHMTKAGVPRKTDPAEKKPRHLWKKIDAVAIWSYLVAIVVLWIWMRWRGDRGPWATIFLFGPRWLCLTPLAVLAPLAAIWRRRLAWVLLIAFVIGLGPVCGFRIHLPRPDAPYKLRIVTCNVGQQRYSASELAELIKVLDPDIVALQECKRDPPRLIWPPGWHAERFDELLVASPHPFTVAGHTSRPAMPSKPAVALFRVELPSGELQLFNLHLMTPRPGLEAVLDSHRGIDLAGLPALRGILRLRDQESEAISRWVLDHPGPKVVVGDFNTPADSVTFRRDWSSLTNAFSAAGLGFGFTKLTETQGWTFGARIDHVLYSTPWHCVRAWVGPDIGSDHRPLIVDLR
jgi:endonuclease/exonuclease/phosphatase (EEP) superfamily protein YafD